MSWLALGLLFNVALLGWAFGAFDGGGDNDDEADDFPDDRDDGGDGGDNEHGDNEDNEDGEDDEDEDEERRQNGAILDGTGTAGDDTLVVADTDTLTGGAGADLFYIVRADETDGVLFEAQGVTITDFDPAEDRILILSTPDQDFDSPERIEVLDWEPQPDGFSLIVDPEGAGSDNAYEAVFLEGLTEAPPDAVVATNMLLSRAPTPIAADFTRLDAFFDGTANFPQQVQGTDAAELFDYDDGGDDADGFDRDGARILGLDAGGGNDTVAFSGQFAEVFLGDGDDVFTGTSSIYLNEEDAQERAFGGAGNDTITMGEAIVLVDGGAGNDVLSAPQSQGGIMSGGAGDDTLSGALSAFAEFLGTAPLQLEGDAGTDTFIVPFSGSQDFIGPVLLDFDPVSEVIVVQLPGGYTGAGAVTLEASSEGGTSVLLDGQAVVRVGSGLADASLVTVVAP